MTTTVHFPWPVLAAPMSLEVAVDDPVDADVDGAARIVVLDPSWSTLAFTVRTASVADELRELSARTRVIVELHAPDAKLRRAVRASLQSDGSYVAHARLWREEVSGRLEVTASAVDESDPGRYLGRSATWMFWLDERPPFRGDVTKGPFPVRWIDFANPTESGLAPEVSGRLDSNTQALWFLDTVTTTPAHLLLNRGSSGFHKLMNSTAGGRVGALRNLVGLQVATEVLRDLAVRALADISVDDDNEVSEPADPLLKTMLGHLFDALEVTDGERSDFCRKVAAAFATGGVELARLIADVSAAVTNGHGLATSIDRAWKVIGDD